MPKVKFFTINGKKVRATITDNRKLKSCELDLKNNNHVKNRYAVCRSSIAKKKASQIKN